MQDKRKRNLLFFLYFSKAHCKQHKSGETVAFKNLLSPEGNLPVDDIEVKKKSVQRLLHIISEQSSQSKDLTGS